MFVLGNRKLSKKIAIFPLPPGKTCPNCSLCYAKCYARKFYRMYPNVRSLWDANLEASKEDVFIEKAVDELESLEKKIIAVRIHSSGDFYSREYYERWEAIAGEFPKIQFFAYTKVQEIWNSWKRKHPANLNLILSFINYELNFGSEAYCQWLVKYFGAFLCPTGHDKRLVCGEDCKYCFKGQSPCFIQH